MAVPTQSTTPSPFGARAEYKYLPLLSTVSQKFFTLSKLNFAVPNYGCYDSLKPKRTGSMKNVATLITYIFFILLTSTYAYGGIAVDKSIIDIIAGQTRRSDIYISNPDDSPQDVTLEISKIINPGTPQEKRIKIDNPRELGVIVTPTEFTLAPGERRKARLSFISIPRETDFIYRLLVRPVNIPDSGSSKKPMIQVVFNYDILVSYRPSSPDTSFTVKRTENAITFTNTGNSNFLLYAGEQCEAKGVNCRVIPAHRMYAGTSHTIPIDPSNAYIRFLRKDAGSTEFLEYQ